MNPAPGAMPRTIAFDLETTGQDRETCRIVQIHLIEFDEQGCTLGSWGTLVNPQMPIPAEATAVHGIRDEDVAGRKPFAAHARRVQDLVRGAVLVGFNLDFDVPVLHRELERAGQPGIALTQPRLDAFLVEKVVNSHRLDATYERYLGRKLEDAHDSQVDTQAAIQVLFAQLRRHPDLFPGGLRDMEAQRVRLLLDPKARLPLDHHRKFHVRAEDGIVRFGFGKHKDESVDKEPGYLEWMLRQDFTPDVMRIAQHCLGQIQAGQVPHVDVAALAPQWGGVPA
jgi:DNA polymerase-3 subunit epsilon